MRTIQIMEMFDTIIYVYTGLSVFYLFIFAFFSRFRRTDHYPAAKKRHRILVLFPAYKEDRVIVSSIQNFLAQKYPRTHYDAVVISDQLSDETINKLLDIRAEVLKVNFENSSKAKALNFAVSSLGEATYDVVVIMDADNIVEPDFLDQINRAYSAGAMAIQCHRKGKNSDTDIAILDAVSEEMNNAYFRKGHVFLGLSSALSGSGMAFDFKWFRENVSKLNSAGEDKELETLLLKQRIYIEYLHDVPVYDEKVQSSAAFYKQRQRWLAAQFGTLKMAMKDLPGALFSGNYDYADKLVQWMMLPRILLLGFITLFSMIIPFFRIDLALKWWGLFLTLLITFGLAIPKEMDNRALEKALIKIPLLFVLMFMNLFRLRGVNKKFIHTTHGQPEN